MTVTMSRALLRTAVADLRSYRLQALLIVVILAAATASLALAALVQRTAAAPYDRLLRDTNGAHLWFTAAGVDLAPVATMDGVTGVAGPYSLRRGYPMIGVDPFGRSVDSGTDLIGMPAAWPQTGQPLVTAGRWLAAGSDEIVLDVHLAQMFNKRPGDRVELRTPNGPVAFQVVGLAQHPVSWIAEADGLSHAPTAYLLPHALAALPAPPTNQGSVLGVRLADPDASGAFAARAYARFPEGAILSVGDWRDVRTAVTADNKVNVTLLGVFSLFALLAAGFVISNAIGGRVLAQFREIGLLKAIGYTPNQVTRLFLFEHLALGAVAVALGLAAATAIAPFFRGDLAGLLATTPVSLYEPSLFLAIFVGVELIVALFTLLPAWRGGRIATVVAIRTGFAEVATKPSLPARLAARLHLPPAIVVGLKDLFARPLRAALTVAALALTIVTATFSLGMEATIEEIIAHPERWGTPFPLTVEPNGRPAAEIERILAEQPGIRATFPQKAADARLIGQATTVETLAFGGPVDELDYLMPEGRMFAAPGEAVAGQGLLDRLGLVVGDELRLRIDDKPLTLRLVGRVVDPDNAGQTVLYGLDTYRLLIDPNVVPDAYGLQLTPGADAVSVVQGLHRATNGDLLVGVDEGAADAMNEIRAVLIGLNVVLVVIGVVNLLTTTLLGVRERVRDLGILKTLGLAPGQIVLSVVAGVSLLALLAVLVGVPLGLLATRLLFDLLGRQIGIGPGLGTMPSLTGLVLLLPAALLVAALGALLPARRAASLHVADALRYE